MTTLKNSRVCYAIFSLLLGACDTNSQAPSTSRSALSVSGLVISQVYGGGSNSGAPFTHDFIEIFNAGTTSVSLGGLSLQYASATGTGNFGSSAAQLTELPGTESIEPGEYFLVQQGTNATAVGAPLPSPDFIDPTPIAMSGTGGKVALVTGINSLGCNSSSTCSPEAVARILDLVGYGTANYSEGAATPALSNTTAAFRVGAGCSDTDNNAADFAVTAPAPRSGSTARNVCGGGNTGGAGGTGSGGTGGVSAGPAGVCGEPAIRLHGIQGGGSASPAVGKTVVVEAVVVADYQDGDLNGFFLQEEDADQDGVATTSEGIFVFEGQSTATVAVGDLVRVAGKVTEQFGLTQISDLAEVIVCGTASLVTPASVTLPVADSQALEAFESMLVNFAQTLTVTETFSLGRFGSLDLASGGRLYHPNQIAEPGSEEALAIQNDNARNRIILDDARNVQNPNPIPYLGADGTRRVGDTVDGLTAVLSYAFNAYRLQPTAPITFGRPQARPLTAPALPGRLKVATLNTLNFFTTLDVFPNRCGPEQRANDCRGADSVVEFERQRTKLLNALAGLNADVVGLVELENEIDDDAVPAAQSLVDGLNQRLGADTYRVLDTGPIGGDAIKVGFIYKPARVLPVGAYAVLNTSVDPAFIDTLNRPALAQTFREIATAHVFTSVVNHFKSKGSACAGDPDVGLGNCNLVRTAAAESLAGWLASDPTNSGDPDFLIIGDLNAYGKEDPIQALVANGYTNLQAAFLGDRAYSYVFSGESGTLDHALSTPSLTAQVTGIAEWHINADEPTVLDYNVEFKTQDPYNGTDPFRGSDHDPLVVGLNLTESVPTCAGVLATIYVNNSGYVVGGPKNGMLLKKGALLGTNAGDVIVGTAANDHIDARDGADLVCGRTGNDHIVGGLGDDRLYGQDGDDKLNGGAGSNALDGGAGNNSCTSEGEDSSFVSCSL